MKEIKNWNKATQALADKFVETYFEESECWWISDEVGGVYFVNDMFFSVDRMKEALELKATQGQLFDYYHLELERKGVGYSFRAFVKYGKEQMERIINEKK